MGAILRPFDGGSPIALDKPIVLIGRNDSCDVSLENSSKVSRKHCCIVQCGDRFLFRDLGSMNGIRVNTHRVVEMELREGDQIAIADVYFTFCREEGAQKAATNGQHKVAEVSVTTTPPGQEESKKIPVASGDLAVKEE